MKLTASQYQGINTDNKEIIVSAGAGAGKTMVMTERIVKRIREKKVDISNILVVTFTDMAAKSMREKISRKLYEAFRNSEDMETKNQLSESLGKFPGASITTIHSFCLDIIRNFSHFLLDDEGNNILESKFSVADSIEIPILQETVIEDILTSNFVNADMSKDSEDALDFIRLAESFGGSKNNDSLKKTVLSFYQFLRSQPDYIQWMKDYLRQLEDAALDFESSDYCKTLIDNLRLVAENAEEGVGCLKDFLKTKPQLMSKDRDNIKRIEWWSEIADYLDDFIHKVSREDISWNEVCKIAAGMPDFPSFSGKALPGRDNIKEILINHIAEFLYMTTGLFEGYTNKDTKYVFYGDVSRIQYEIEYMIPVVRTFFKIVESFDAEFARRKRELNIIDFSDFEHFALRLLRVKEVGGYYKRKFHEIYIDEYQDTSSIQEAIIGTISGGNVFAVGDVKQSIYRFRHARPEIFLGKYRGAKKINHPSFGEGDRELIELSENFRSLEGIIQCTNDVFRQIMTEDSGEVNYLHNQELIKGRESQGQYHNESNVILMLTKTEAYDGPKKHLFAEIYKKEACGVALEIHKLLKEGVKPEDITILARTKNIAGQFAEVLTMSGLEVLTEKETKTLDNYEFRVMESLLHIIDNPKQDIHLAAVMLSPLFEPAFAENELMEIRCFSGKNTEYFHEAVSVYQENGDNRELKEKTREFVKTINELRILSIGMNPGDFVEYLLDNTGIRGYALALENGEETVKILRNFAIWMRNFTSGRRSGIHEALDYLGELRNSQNKEDLFDINEKEENKIKIITIHKSKGLQYKYVFLVGLSSAIQGKNGKTSADFVYSSEGPPGIFFINPEKNYKYPTPTIFATDSLLKMKSRAEEMRLLYVAMTRAEDRLYLSGRYEYKEDKDNTDLTDSCIKGLETRNNLSIPSYKVLSASTMLQWIIMALARNPKIDLSFLFPAESQKLSLYMERNNGRNINTVNNTANGSFDGSREAGDDAVYVDGNHAYGEGAVQRGDQGGDKGRDKGYKSVGNSGSGAPEYGDFWEVRQMSEAGCVQEFVGRFMGLSDIRPDKDFQSDLSQVETSEINSSERESFEKESFEKESFKKEQSKIFFETSGTEESADISSYLENKFFYEYKYSDSTLAPLKFSVSEIKRRWSQEEENVPQGINLTGVQLISGEEDRLDAARKGVIVHSFARYAPLEELAGKSTGELLESYINNMEKNKIFQKIEADFLRKYIPRFVNYYNNPLALRIKNAYEGNENNVKVELPFTLKVPMMKILSSDTQGKEEEILLKYEDWMGFSEAGKKQGLSEDRKSQYIQGEDGDSQYIQVENGDSQYIQGENGDSQYIQGIIDLLFLEEDGGVIVDYKTDFILGDDEDVKAELMKRHLVQMEIYKKAVEEIRGIKVKEVLIWLFPMDKEYRIC